MWGRHKKLNDWAAAGLITETQAVTIQAYENGRKKGHFGRGLTGLAVFAILVGVVSIIASNWDNIPGFLKITVHALLNIGVGAGAFIALRAGRDVVREGLTLAFFGLTLTLIVLIGQVFQLEGSPDGALSLWMLITLPFMLIFSQGRITALPWLAAFLTTICFVTEKYVPGLPVVWEIFFLLGLMSLLPLALMGDGSFSAMKRWKPVWADAFLKTGAALLAFFTSVSTFLWLERGHYEYQELMAGNANAQLILLSPFAAGLAAILAHAAFHNFYKNDAVMKTGALFAAVSLTVFFLPVIFIGFESPVIQALLFIAYWVFIGWIAQGIGWMRLISFAIVVIAIRIFAIYVEVFGSLMDTGIGLIVGGVVMLGLLVIARRMNLRLTKKEVVV